MTTFSAANDKNFVQMTISPFQCYRSREWWNLGDVIMSAMASQIDCLLNRLFRRRSKKTSKLRVTGLCEGNPPVTGGFPSQKDSNAENVSIWWRHRVSMCYVSGLLKLHPNSSLENHHLESSTRTFIKSTLSSLGYCIALVCPVSWAGMPSRLPRISMKPTTAGCLWDSN